MSIPINGFMINSFHKFSLEINGRFYFDTLSERL